MIKKMLISWFFLQRSKKAMAKKSILRKEFYVKYLSLRSIHKMMITSSKTQSSLIEKDKCNKNQCYLFNLICSNADLIYHIGNITLYTYKSFIIKYVKNDA